MEPRKRLLNRVLVALVILAACSGGCSVARPITTTEIDLLGTVCSITTWKRSEAAVAEAFALIRGIDHRMSATRGSSEVSAINRAAAGAAVRVSPDTLAVVQKSLEFSRLSDGAFDPTVGPLVTLWGIGTEGARVPTPDEIAARIALVDWHGVTVSEADSSVRLERAGMAIDLGAIAKGYAGSRVVELLAARGVKTALVDLGGNVVTLGAKPDGTPWRIGLQDPEPGVPRGQHVGILELAGSMAVVTSGVYERVLLRDGVSYHHILDTRTGAPVANGLTAVTVVIPDSFAADGWSTTLFALGRERGMALAEANGVEALFFTEAREVFATAGIRPRLRMTDARFTLQP